MMVYRKACLACVMALCFSSLAAVITEDTASANALSGITLISGSVGDYQLSPLIGSTGACVSYSRPFGIAEAGTYSLNSATRISHLLFSYGTTYLDQGDYLWQDLRLGFATGYREIYLGYAQHLIYEKISTDDSYHAWSSDLALAWRGAEQGAEIRWLGLGERDAQLHFTLSSHLTPAITAAAAYVHQPHSDDIFRVASSCKIGANVVLQSSWQQAPARFGAGIGIRYGVAKLTYGIRTHTELSLTHSVDLGFSW